MVSCVSNAVLAPKQGESARVRPKNADAGAPRRIIFSPHYYCQLLAFFIEAINHM